MVGMPKPFPKKPDIEFEPNAAARFETLVKSAVKDGPPMKYVWAIVEGLAGIGVAFYVFSKVDTRFEVIVVALLLMTYVAVRISAVALGRVIMQDLIALGTSQALVQKGIGDPDDVERLERDMLETSRKLKGIRPGDIILAALGIVELLCLYRLPTA
jgi:hypothetical protein